MDEPKPDFAETVKRLLRVRKGELKAEEEKNQAERQQRRQSA
jgi:hypothetical protein